jgi:HAD superfamily hydrolase (TIGR01490 family)
MRGLRCERGHLADAPHPPHPAPAPALKFAFFDLDHTLLPIDSADGWLRFLVDAAGLDRAHMNAEIDRHAREYREGRFDVEGYLAFQMGLLARFDRAQLDLWRTQYLRSQVFPHLRFEAQTLVQKYRSEGWQVALVTGTHSYVTRPIAALFEIEHLIAVQPEEVDGKFTGRYLPPHTYQDGKRIAVEAFLAQRGTSLAALEDSTFYSDSINDLPLLEAVRHPVVTNGDSKLRHIAKERGWPTLELFETLRAA